MNVTVYVPKELEEELKRRAKDAGMTPSLLIQSVLRTALLHKPERFSDAFASLAGSWDDQRGAQEIIEDIKKHRRDLVRSELR